MVENLPGTDKVLIHLYENAEEKTERLYWVYDEYRIEAENTCDVLGNYDALMAQAKLAEAEKADGAFWREGERVLSVSEQLTAAQAALAEIAEELGVPADG